MPKLASILKTNFADLPKKTAEMGGAPPTLTESPLSFFWNKIFLKELKMMFLYQIRLTMDQKVHIRSKRQEIEFLDLKNLLFSGIFLSRISGYPPPPPP